MNMNTHHSLRRHAPKFAVTLAQTPDALQQALQLRYRVFVQELGATGATVDHVRAIETDAYDAHSEHLILRDLARPEGHQVVGVYRLLPQESADRVGGFYTETEFDLSQLRSSSKRLLELGRSCIAPEYRGTTALLHLWQAVGRYVVENKIEVLFGTASFQGNDPATHADALSFLNAEHLAPKHLRATAKTPNYFSNDHGVAAADRRSVQKNLPSLIKSYLRMGGSVGAGAYIDAGFKTTDVCMIVDVAAISPRQRALYTQ